MIENREFGVQDCKGGDIQSATVRINKSPRLTRTPPGPLLVFKNDLNARESMKQGFTQNKKPLFPDPQPY